MRVFLATICLLLFSGMPVLAVDNPSLERVAIYALRAAFESSSGQNWEYGGVIVLRNRELIFTTPTTSFNDHHVNIIPTPYMQKGDVLMGTFHTHPCRPVTYLGKYFSVLDMNLVRDYLVPAFILDECTGDVHEFDPFVDDPKANGIYVPDFPKMRFLTSGRVVGNIGKRGVDLDAQGTPKTND
jgi:proteasome lid subunit RPN8/RPN11